MTKKLIFTGLYELSDQYVIYFSTSNMFFNIPMDMQIAPCIDHISIGMPLQNDYTLHVDRFHSPSEVIEFITRKAKEYDIEVYMTPRFSVLARNAYEKGNIMLPRRVVLPEDEVPNSEGSSTS